MWQILPLLGVVALIVILLQQEILNSVSQSLTDMALAFNLDFYRVLYSRIEFMNLGFVNLMYLIALPLVLLLDKRMRSIAIAFLFTSITYLFLASKAIRFAFYYHHIFVLTQLIFIGCIIYLVTTRCRNITLLQMGALGLILCLAVFAPSADLAFKQDFSLGDTQNAAKYLKENLGTHEKVMIFSFKHSIVYLYSDRIPVLGTSLTKDPQELESVKQEIAEKGFYNFLMKNNITYLLGDERDIQFSKLSYLFVQDEVGDARTDIILQKMGEDQDRTEVKQAFREYRPDLFFEETDYRGRIQIYKVVNPDSNGS
jgi:hypothetical protein